MIPCSIRAYALLQSSAEWPASLVDATAPSRDAFYTKTTALSSISWFYEAQQRRQTTSVLGWSSPLKLPEATWEGTGKLDLLLQELKRLEFLYERSGTEESGYVFEHA